MVQPMSTGLRGTVLVVGRTVALLPGIIDPMKPTLISVYNCLVNIYLGIFYILYSRSMYRRGREGGGGVGSLLTSLLVGHV